MKKMEKLKEILSQQHGTLLASDLKAYDIPRTYLQMMVAEGVLERVDRGIYVFFDAVEDELYAMQVKYPKLIYSHETALYLQGLSDRTPCVYSATVPSGYKVVSSIAERFKIYYIKKDLHEMGVITLMSPSGNPIRTYGLERTFCDLLRSKQRMDIQIFAEAMKGYGNLDSLDYHSLLEYAGKLRVQEALKIYSEVLL